MVVVAAVVVDATVLTVDGVVVVMDAAAVVVVVNARRLPIFNSSNYNYDTGDIYSVFSPSQIAQQQIQL